MLLLLLMGIMQLLLLLIIPGLLLLPGLLPGLLLLLLLLLLRLLPPLWGGHTQRPAGLCQGLLLQASKSEGKAAAIALFRPPADVWAGGPGRLRGVALPAAAGRGPRGPPGWEGPLAPRLQQHRASRLLLLLRLLPWLEAWLLLLQHRLLPFLLLRLQLPQQAQQVQDRNLHAEPDVEDRPIWAVLQGAGLSGHPDIQHDDKKQKTKKARPQICFQCLHIPSR